jgi:hypothetical protein
MSVFNKMSRIIDPPKPSKIPTNKTPKRGAYREFASVAPNTAPNATAPTSSHNGKTPGVIKVGSSGK